jgi:uncharacterized protein (DUF779 family)
LQVRGTDAAVQALRDLAAAHGPLMLFVSGGCCDGSAPLCLLEGELVTGAGDLLLGEVGGAEVYIDADQCERWNRPELTIDVAPGAAGGFSLEGLAGIHFVTR